MTLGNRIAAHRKAAGLSQEALAAKLGVSRQAIGKWEADASLPGLDNLHQLAKELGVTIDALLTGGPNEEPADGGPAADTPEPGMSETAPPAFLTSEEVISLLGQQAQRERRGRRRLLLTAGVPVAAAVLALAAGLVWQGGQLAALRGRLDLVQGNLATLDSSLDSLQSRLDASITGQGQSFSESLAAGWDIQTKEYSPAEGQVLMALSATPSTITDDCAVRFTFVLSDGQSIVMDASRGDGDVFSAEGWIPLAESYTLNMSLTRGGETKVEQLYTEPAFAAQYEMQIRELPLVMQSASYTSFSKTYTLRQAAGDYEIPVEVNYSRQGLPLQWPVKAWLTATLEGEEVLNMPLDTDFIQPGSENGPGDPSSRVTFYLRFSLEEKTFKLPWKAEYEREPYPRLDYQLHILDNGGTESTYSLNP